MARCYMNFVGRYMYVMGSKRSWNFYNRTVHRLSGHKYDAGVYFVTICTFRREHFFGEIIDAKMSLNALGNYAAQALIGIDQHYSNARCLSFVIMPKHVHAIIVITPSVAACHDILGSEKAIPHNSPLGKVVCSFKSAVTRYANINDIGFAWQPRFYDRIVRSVQELNAVTDYIENNPVRWAEDEYNK